MMMRAPGIVQEQYFPELDPRTMDDFFGILFVRQMFLFRIEQMEGIQRKPAVA
jgi:hypothetical protein